MPGKVKSDLMCSRMIKQTLGKVEDNGSQVERAITPANGLGMVNAERENVRKGYD